MPSLHIIRGPNQGQTLNLEGDSFILGRNPDCTVVIQVNSVSREHARIQREGRDYFIEDLKSRNHTFVNETKIASPTPLRDKDRIRICDFVAEFRAEEEPEDDGSTSTVEATLGHQSGTNLLESQPHEKLRALIEISGNLNKNLQLDNLLPNIADSLFQIFRQADRCFIIQSEEGTDRLFPRVVRTRRERDETNARFSKSIVRRCLERNEALLSDDATRDHRIELSQSVIDFKIRSVMCVPIVTPEGKALGVLQLDTQDRSKKFTTDDLKLLWAVSNQAAIALENAQFHESKIAQERFKRDLELAHDVQISFLPRSFPEVPGYEFAACYEPAQAVGGDYYTFVPLPDGKIAVVMADVAGKGIPAALVVARLSSDTSLCLLTEPDPARAISKLNDLLYAFISPVDRFVTLALAVLDTNTHTVTLVNAGHMSPLLYRPEPLTIQETVPNEIAGLPMGILDGYTFDSCQITLEPGDNLVLYTDGVTDPVNRQQQPFGNQGIHDTLKAAGKASPQGIVDKVFSAVQKHSAGSAPFDDITLLCLGRKE